MARAGEADSDGVRANWVEYVVPDVRQTPAYRSLAGKGEFERLSR